MRVRFPATIALIAAIGGCVFQSPRIQQVNGPAMPQHITTPVKAHLKDGSTVLYTYGVSRDGNDIVGSGNRFSIGSQTPTRVTRISLDSIAGMESYGRDVNVAGSVIVSLLATGAGVVAAAGLAVAIFGSCPTIYADSAGTELLQAETFSYAIAPLFEQRDVDRLRLTTTPDGRVVLRVRNEMLETHFINHLELLEVKHSENEDVVPDQSGEPLSISRERLPISIVDRAGRDISKTARASDGDVFSTVDARLASVTADDLDDYIDITVEAPANQDTVALELDMRNSLLNTVLLYDHILGAPGLKSLDYVGKDLEHISNAVDVGRWYSSNMGMRISVLDNGRYRRVTRVGDSGPIAFHRMAVLVPAIKSGDNKVHVRLSFVADDWRIDRISVGSAWRRPAIQNIPVSRVMMPDPAQNAKTITALSQPDEAYLITSPGQSFSVEFDVGRDTNTGRTFLVATQGYYTEWVRGDWIKNASGKPFTPTNDVLVDAIRGWRAKQKSMEALFYTQRIAAR